MYDDITIRFIEDIDVCSVDELCRYILKTAPFVSDWPVLGRHVSDVLRYTNTHERNRQYHQFEIPKKSGGTRQIIAPVGDLKIIQKVLAHLLAMVSSPDDHAHGFIEKRSVITNAQQHIGKNYVLNLDLKNFFPGIYFHHVVNALQKYFSRDVSVFIAKLCTWTETGDDLPEDVLPQGAPTSPVLSNIVCEAMDARLGGLAKRFGLTYTRYADDMTFSSYHSIYAKGSDFWTELHSIIEDSGFRLNEKKTRLLKKGSRQEVTGITVGERLNVSRKWMKNLRAQVFQYEMYGGSEEEYRSIMGKIAFLKMVRGGDDDRSCRLYRRIRYSHRAVPMLEQHWSGEYNPHVKELLEVTDSFYDYAENPDDFDEFYSEF